MIKRGEVFEVKKPTGFKSVGFAVIKDAKNNKVFYAFYKGENESVKFNLPKGTYKSSTDLITLSGLFKYKTPFKRKRDRFDFEVPKKVSISYGINPNKATIDLSKGEILLDNSFKNRPEIVRKFVQYHEIGHFYYISESDCDEYAQNRLLNEGYNLSQVMFATQNALSKGNKRVDECLSKLSKTKIK